MCEKERLIAFVLLFIIVLSSLLGYPSHPIPPMKGSDDVAKHVIRISIQIMMEVRVVFFSLSTSLV